MKFYIIVTGYNCQNHAENCIKSIAAQTHQDFECIIIDDGSTDQTTQSIKRILSPLWNVEKAKGIHPIQSKYILTAYSKNLFAAYRRYEAIYNLRPRLSKEDVIVTVDLDDQIFPSALEIIAKKYRDPNVWMTYGNWITHKGKINPTPLLYSREDFVNRNFRHVPYRCVSPNTFKVKLWDKIPQSDYFGPDGKWLEICTETGFRLSCMEMCGMQRIAIITEPIYRYTAHRAGNTQKKYGQAFKDSIRDFVFSQSKKQLYEQQPDIAMLPLREPEMV